MTERSRTRLRVFIHKSRVARVYASGFRVIDYPADGRKAGPLFLGPRFESNGELRETFGKRGGKKLVIARRKRRRITLEETAGSKKNSETEIVLSILYENSSCLPVS